MELRKFPRFLVELHALFSGDDMEGEGTVYNLSYGGCAVRSNAALHQDSYLQLEIYLPARLTRILVDLAPVRWASKH